MRDDERSEPERQLPLDPDIETDEDIGGRPSPIHTRPRFLLLVAAGGAFGTAARHLLGDAIGFIGPFPLGTFLINIAGAFLLGVLLELLVRHGSDLGHRRGLRLLLGTGFFGGFTTYSSLALDTDTLLRGSHIGLAALYALGTVAIGLIASVSGIAVARRGVHA